MKSSVFLKNEYSEQTSPNKDDKSISAPDEITIKQEPSSSEIKQEPSISTTNVSIQSNPMTAHLVPVNLTQTNTNVPQNTILIPQSQPFKIDNSNATKLIPITTLPVQQPVAVQQLIAIPAANPTLTNQTSALQTLQQSLNVHKNPLPPIPRPVKQEIVSSASNTNVNHNINTNTDTNNMTQSERATTMTRQGHGLPLPPSHSLIQPARPIPQQQTVLIYQQQRQTQPKFIQNNINNGPLTLKDEKLNENWSAKIAYAATLSSVE